MFSDGQQLRCPIVPAQLNGIFSLRYRMLYAMIILLDLIVFYVQCMLP